MTNDQFSIGGVATGIVAWLTVLIFGIVHYGWFLGGAAGPVLGYVAFLVVAALWRVALGLAAISILATGAYLLGGMGFVAVTAIGLAVAAAWPAVADAVREHVQRTDDEQRQIKDQSEETRPKRKG